MSLNSIVGHRASMWRELLEDWGYESDPSAMRTESVAPGRLKLRAVKPKTLGDPPVTITISETWVPGHDPEGSAPYQDGCYRQTQSWHAQVGGGRDEEGAERLDRDPKKSPAYRVHRHPLGEINDVREPCALMQPNQWLEHVGVLLLERYAAESGVDLERYVQD